MVKQRWLRWSCRRTKNLPAFDPSYFSLWSCCLTVVSSVSLLRSCLSILTFQVNPCNLSFSTHFFYFNRKERAFLSGIAFYLLPQSIFHSVLFSWCFLLLMFTDFDSMPFILLLMSRASQSMILMKEFEGWQWVALLKSSQDFFETKYGKEEESK